MRSLALSLLLPFAALSAGADEIEALRQSNDGVTLCDRSGQWCMRTDPRHGPMLLNDTDAEPLMNAAELSEAGTARIWPHLIPIDRNRAIIGIQQSKAGGYSGGGFNVDHLKLYSVTAGEPRAVAPVLDIPISAELSIRACFSTDDVEKRHGFCHDEYSYDGRIQATGRKTYDVPDLLLRTTASRRPAGISRLAETKLVAPLTEEQIAGRGDAECSFSAVFSWDLDSASYRPESPIPDCSEFTQP